MVFIFCGSSRHMTATEYLNAAMRKEIVLSLADRLTSDYVFADTGSKMASALRAKLESNAYEEVTSVYEFARILTEDLYAIARDRHLRVSFKEEPLSLLQNKSQPTDSIEQIRKMNGGIEEVELLDGNIGYMRINAVPFFDVSKDAISAAFASLHDTDALILDNRENRGGDPRTVAWYMSYLSEGEPYLVNSFYWRKDDRIEEFWTTDLGNLSYGAMKPVFVLTSPATFSGGEELAYDIKVFERGTIIGAVTAGASNPGSLVPIAHHFQAFIPIGRAVNPITGGNWEGVGVTPDIEVPHEQALTKALSVAISRLEAVNEQ